MQHPVTLNAFPLYSVIHLTPVIYFLDPQITQLQTTYGWLDRVGVVRELGQTSDPKQSHNAIPDMSPIQA